MTEVIISEHPALELIAESDEGQIVSERSSLELITESEETRVVVETRVDTLLEAAATEVISEGLQGPQGPPGISPATLKVIAHSAMSAHRIMAYDSENAWIEYADHLRLSHAGKVLGLSINAAAANELLEICISGEIIEPAWNWTPGLVFLGRDGQMTQTAPTAGFLQVVGVAIGPTRLVVNTLNPVFL